MLLLNMTSKCFFYNHNEDFMPNFRTAQISVSIETMNQMTLWTTHRIISNAVVSLYRAFWCLSACCFGFLVYNITEHLGSVSLLSSSLWLFFFKSKQSAIPHQYGPEQQQNRKQLVNINVSVFSLFWTSSLKWPYIHHVKRKKEKKKKSIL